MSYGLLDSIKMIDLPIKKQPSLESQKTGLLGEPKNWPPWRAKNGLLGEPSRCYISLPFVKNDKKERCA
ncbi:hypothetical protein AS030_16845 [Fictibacillus enclensis]|uniref:Uncharacterized protein n=1 Tax=Fictibacillus enclensis TaxID=1017270 RepID=A0A0V8J495_9BACL|nr:hypothetical protein AS030_16845 [Fictibacillus enclensis]